MTALLAERLSKTFHDGESELHVLRDANLAIRAGETVAILGRSGTGKSTLLHLLGLLDRPTAGEIRVQGRPVQDLSERERTKLRGQTFGFVFQHYHLVAEFTALENAALGAAVAQGGGLGGARRARARELLAAVGLSDRESHTPARLSGGEQQRVAIARALASRPSILLCDEPTGNLDPQTGQTVLDILWTLVRRENAAMALVTHDPAVAERADRRFRLEAGDLQAG